MYAAVNTKCSTTQKLDFYETVKFDIRLLFDYIVIANLLTF